MQLGLHRGVTQCCLKLDFFVPCYCSPESLEENGFKSIGFDSVSGLLHPIVFDSKCGLPSEAIVNEYSQKTWMMQIELSNC